MTESDRPIDPARSLRLLWGLELPASRGPKPKLTLDQLVDGAIEIADEEGFEALSMRRLADRLGVGVMTIYTYVQGKRDLLDLMYERVVADSFERLQAGLTGAGRWLEKLEMLARDRWEVHQLHLWFGQVPWTRTPFGPKILDSYELALSTLDELGLNGREMSEILTLISAYVDGAARGATEARTLPTTTSVGETEWWEAVSPVLEQIWDAERYPLITRYEFSREQEGWPEDDYFLTAAKQSFEFGLARVLEGVEAFVNSKVRARKPLGQTTRGTNEKVPRSTPRDGRRGLGS